VSTEVLDQAGQATMDIKLALRELILRLQTLDTTCNALGVLNDHGMLQADLDQSVRDIYRIQSKIILTQWPKAADYAEV
jgi:hypothetical protein